LIDTHCHLTSRVLHDDVDGVIDRAVAAGVRRMITVATTSDDALACLAIAERRPEVFCSAGMHPLYSAEAVNWSVIERIIAHPRCVAWGELGLDNYYKEPARELQDRIFTEQIELIRSVDRREHGAPRPIIVHSREAQADLLPLFESSGIDPARLVFHCFTGTPEEADRLVAFGSMVSFTGAVTYASAAGAAEAAARIPLDRIMVETDAPYMTPQPHRKVRPNEPSYVRFTAESIARSRGMDPEEFERITDANAERFFALPEQE